MYFNAGIFGLKTRTDTFALGVCNGCQMLSALQEIIPGTDHWPRFARNRSEQYEARLSLVRVEASPSVLLSGMEGSHLPIVVAHGEGCAQFASADEQASLEAAGSVAAIAARFARWNEHAQNLSCCCCLFWSFFGCSFPVLFCVDCTLFYPELCPGCEFGSACFLFRAFAYGALAAKKQC